MVEQPCEYTKNHFKRASLESAFYGVLIITHRSYYNNF